MIHEEGVMFRTPEDILAYGDRRAEAERERITKILLQRLEYFDCDICGECVTPTRLVEMINEESE